MTAAVSHLRATPSAIDSEREILGACLIDPGAYYRVADSLEADDFFHPVHARIWKACQALSAAERPIDPISVKHALETADEWRTLDGVGGVLYLAELQNAVASLETIGYHAEKVAECSRRSRTINAAGEVAALAQRGEEGWDELGGAALFAALERRREDTLHDARGLARAVQAEVEARAKPGHRRGLLTGLSELDALVGGLQPARQYVIAGRPSAGKTSLARQIAVNAAILERIPCLIFSVETTAAAMLEHAACAGARIDTQRPASGNMTLDDWSRWYQAIGKISDAPITFDDDGAPSLADIRARVRRWRATMTPEAQKVPAVVMIDYLQLLDHARTKGETTTEAIGRTSRGLKRLAKECGIVLIVLSQLNRESEREQRRPRLSDLRDSGAIEADADVVVFCHRPKQDGIEVELVVAKNKAGPIGLARVAFHRTYVHFDNLSSADAPPRYEEQS